MTNKFTSTNRYIPSSLAGLSNTSITYRFRGGVSFRDVLDNSFSSIVPSINTILPSGFIVNNSILNIG